MFTHYLEKLFANKEKESIELEIKKAELEQIRLENEKIQIEIFNIKLEAFQKVKDLLKELFKYICLFIIFVLSIFWGIEIKIDNKNSNNDNSSISNNIIFNF